MIRKLGQIVVFVSTIALVFGCGSLIDMGKKQTCMIDEQGNYTGEPKEKAVSQVASLIKRGADMAGQEISEEDAQKYATEALKQFCSGAIDNIELPFAVFKVMRKDVGDTKAFNTAVNCVR